MAQPQARIYESEILNALFLLFLKMSLEEQGLKFVNVKARRCSPIKHNRYVVTVYFHDLADKEQRKFKFRTKPSQQEPAPKELAKVIAPRCAKKCVTEGYPKEEALFGFLDELR